MAKFTLKASLLPFIVVIVLLWSMPSASSAATATAFRLPPGNELEALAAAPSGSAFAMVFHPFSISGKVAQGWYVYEVSSAGSVRELPAMIPQSPVGNAGIAAAGPESVWVPTPHSVLLVDSGGIEKSVSVGRTSIDSLAGDRQGGVWVAAATRVFHVGQTGTVSRLHLGSLKPGRLAMITSMVLDRKGNLWLAVARGFEQLTKEVVEHSPDGEVRTFKVGRRFLPTEDIGVSQGRPVIQTGQEFLRLDRTGELRRRISVAGNGCPLTETAEIWCSAVAPGWFYRTFPKGDPAALKLPQLEFPEPPLRVYDLAPSGGSGF